MLNVNKKRGVKDGFAVIVQFLHKLGSEQTAGNFRGTDWHCRSTQMESSVLDVSLKSLKRRSKAREKNKLSGLLVRVSRWVASTGNVLDVFREL